MQDNDPRREIKRLLKQLRVAEQRIAHLERECAAAAARRQQIEAAADRLRRDRRQFRHAMFVAGVLRDRIATLRGLPLPAFRAAAAAERESAFLRSSPAYARAREEAWPADDAARVEIDGLTFWVPLDERLPERAERAAAQDLAYRAIVQGRELNVGGTMIDIGANLGRTSVPRVLLGDVDAVYAVEADPFNYRCLVHTIIDNGLAGLILPDHAAIAAIDGTATLRRSRFVGGHRLLRDGADRADTVKVESRTLDGWLRTHGVSMDGVRYVKIDVQGWEPAVLAGASALLSCRHVVWELEVDPHLLTAAGFSVPDLIARLSGAFSRFVDTNPDVLGPRHRPIDELADALAYLTPQSKMKTDLLFYNAR